jgi:lipoprotein-anchoring transpeptidase ErfK/SrfK
MSTIEHKTIRPGSLNYTYYKSGVSPEAPKDIPKKHRFRFRSLVLVLAIIIIAPIAYTAAASSGTTKTPITPNKTAPAVTTKTTVKTTAPTAAAVNHCSSNTLSQLILVSISARHLWACNGSTSVYDSPVVTGDTEHADTLTPIGTYHIYAKETDRTLTGSDENGSWSDFVNYWMPFLYNQYGAYGLHDATWRDASAFGNIDPSSSTASNGCVELPLATAKWLYNWDSVGTTVTIEA